MESCQKFGLDSVSRIDLFKNLQKYPKQIYTGKFSQDNIKQAGVRPPGTKISSARQDATATTVLNTGLITSRGSGPPRGSFFESCTKVPRHTCESLYNTSKISAYLGNHW